MRCSWLPPRNAVTARLERLTGRIAEMDEADRQAHMVDRMISCKVSDLRVTFLTRIGPDGATPVLEAERVRGPSVRQRDMGRQSIIQSLDE